MDAAALSKRRRAALPGSSYDRLVVILKVALPLVALAVLATCLIWPLTARQEFSFLLSKDRVAEANERLRVSRAEYRGEDSKGQPFRITAGSAIQKTSDVPVVELKDITAELQEADGPVHAVADAGRYDIEHDRISVVGPLKINRADGSLINTRDVSLDMASRVVTGKDGVQGSLPLGTFRGQTLNADVNKRVVRLGGGVRLHIVQRRG